MNDIRLGNVRLYVGERYFMTYDECKLFANTSLNHGCLRFNAYLRTCRNDYE